MIYDCVLFNDELDLLELRLSYMYNEVDFFVIAESAITHSNQPKKLFYFNNKDRFKPYQDKIIYIEIPPVEQKDSWEGEFYQRNYLKTGLKDCTGDDLIIIADIDEIVNVEFLKLSHSITQPIILDTPMYYYFFNLKTNVRWQKVLLTPYKFIKDFDIGNRINYKHLNPKTVKGDSYELGWHFSYMFGYDINLYKSKLVSFSHQEYNSAYYLNDKRINACVKLGVDFLERYSIYYPVKLSKEIPAALLTAISKVYNLKNVVYKKPGIAFYLDPVNLKYFLKLVVKLKLAILRARLMPPQQ